MRALHLGQHFAVAVALSLTLLIVGTVGLGVGIQHGDIRPPEMDVSFSGRHIVAYTTDPIECRPYYYFVTLNIGLTPIGAAEAQTAA